MWNGLAYVLHLRKKHLSFKIDWFQNQNCFTFFFVVYALSYTLFYFLYLQKSLYISSLNDLPIDGQVVLAENEFIIRKHEWESSSSPLAAQSVCLNVFLNALLFGVKLPRTIQTFILKYSLQMNTDKVLVICTGTKS